MRKILLIVLLVLTVACNLLSTPSVKPTRVPPTPTALLQPTAEPSATASNTPLPPPTDTPVCEPNAKFVADISIPDGTNIPAGLSFVKTWRMASTGCAAWPQGTVLVFDRGNRMGTAGVVAVLPTASGTKADISVVLVAPPVAGKYKGYWQLVKPDGTRFGDELFVVINVIAPTPAPTSVPPTATVVPTNIPTNTPIPTIESISITIHNDLPNKNICTIRVKQAGEDVVVITKRIDHGKTKTVELGVPATYTVTVVSCSGVNLARVKVTSSTDWYISSDLLP